MKQKLSKVHRTAKDIVRGPRQEWDDYEIHKTIDCRGAITEFIIESVMRNIGWTYQDLWIVPHASFGWVNFSDPPGSLTIESSLNYLNSSGFHDGVTVDK